MSHHHHHHSTGNAAKNISVAFFLNAAFVVIELVGGLLTNSIAILTDALHDFGDCLSLAIAWMLRKKIYPGTYIYLYLRLQAILPAGQCLSFGSARHQFYHRPP